MYYECHVTIDPKYANVVEIIAEVHKFKTSVLKGDEIMGDDKLLYCTCHDRNFETIHNRMEGLIWQMRMQQIPILRKKIEHILLDERYNNLQVKSD